jgi:hypothetical protein
MRLATLAAAIFIACELQAAAGQAQAETPILQVGLFGYRPDGSGSASAYDTEPSLASLTYLNANGCQVGAGNQEPPAHATDAWRFSGKVLSRTREEVVLQLEWQRVLADGTPAASPGASQQLTLRNGDRVLLDSVIPADTRCWTSVGFEVRFNANSREAVAAAAAMIRSQKGARGGGVGVSAGAPSGSGSGRTNQEHAGSGGAASVSGHARHPVSGSGGGRHEWVSARPNFDVSLWLVRSVAGKPDEVWHQTLLTGHNETAFAFAPVSVETARGAVVLQVTGSVAVSNSAAGPQLQFETKRRATFPVTGNAPRDGGQDAQGGSRTTIPLPGPEEVLSFQLPPLPARSDRPAVPDQLSVRVRITPR